MLFFVLHCVCVWCVHDACLRICVCVWESRARVFVDKLSMSCVCVGTYMLFFGPDSGAQILWAPLFGVIVVKGFRPHTRKHSVCLRCIDCTNFDCVEHKIFVWPGPHHVCLSVRSLELGGWGFNAF